MPPIRLLGTFLCLFLFLGALAAASPSRGRSPADNDDGGDNGDDVQPSQSVAGATSTTSLAATSTNTTAVLQGDVQCPGSQLMCVTGIVNGSTITYELQSTGSQSLGWMAIGFGEQMANTPMVIMWLNADGTITLSQRQASGQNMPTPVASPPKVATAQPTLSTLTGSQPVLTFTIDGTATQVPLIWAFGSTRPAEAAGSTIQQHLESGTFTLDLTKTLTSNSTSRVGSSAGSVPLLSYQKTIIAHAVVVTFGFLFLLPAGVLLARYTRTYYPRWFTAHWVIQAGIAGPFIVVGCVLGYVAVNQQGSDVSSPHKRIGTILLALYLCQCVLGAFIHFVKIRFRFGRPPQNYFHAIFGLVILALAFYQVHIGYDEEWPNTTGRSPVANVVNIVWIVWIVVFALLYSGGLAYLPRQWRQERPKASPTDQDKGVQSNDEEGSQSNDHAGVQLNNQETHQLQMIRNRAAG
ncbi:hypothetical protein BU17DRAFT_100499 [Hysterangium stoloniferum]|nr:hypothetical protein BU17DRAFT_100499 [Hysterangium stoloniferum]